MNEKMVLVWNIVLLLIAVTIFLIPVPGVGVVALPLVKRNPLAKVAGKKIAWQGIAIYFWARTLS